MGGLAQVAGVAISYQRRQLSAKANCEGAMPLPSMIALMVPSGRTRPRILITWSEGSLGVPCSPNRHLEELRIFRQIDLPGRQIEPHSLSDVRPGLVLGFAGGGAAGELGAHGRIIAGLEIMFQNDPERHTHSLLLRT